METAHALRLAHGQGSTVEMTVTCNVFGSLTPITITGVVAHNGRVVTVTKHYAADGNITPTKKA